MLCEPEQVTHILRTDCEWTGQAADAVDTVPASPKSLLGLPAAEATVDPACIHHGYQHLPASLLEPFPASWERPQPACRPAPKCQRLNPTGKAPYRDCRKVVSTYTWLPHSWWGQLSVAQGGKVLVKGASMHLYWIASSSLPTAAPPHLFPEIISQNIVSPQVPSGSTLGQPRLRQELIYVSSQVLTTLIRRNYC